MSKRKFLVELEGCEGLYVSELKEYIEEAIDTHRGCMSPDEPVHDFKVVSVNSFIDTKTKRAKSMPHEIRFLTPLSEKAIILLGELLKSTGELIWVDNTLVKWNTQDKVFEVTKNRRVYKSYGDIASALRGSE